MKKALMEALLRGGRLPLGLPGSLGEELEEMLKSNSRPKTAHEIELAAAMTGKKSEIKYLNECIEGFSEKVAELTKELEEKDATIKRLYSDVDRLKTDFSIQANDIGRKGKHIANITAEKEDYSNKLIAISKVISNAEPITAKTAKADLLKVVEKIKAAL